MKLLKMKRLVEHDGWIRTKKPRVDKEVLEPDYKENLTGVIVRTSDVKCNHAFVPKWIASLSDVLDHIFEDEEEDVIDYPALKVEGVTAKSLRDVVMLYQMSKPLIELFGNQDFKWQYHSKNKVMDKVLTTVYRWRTRLGYLISTSSFFGWPMLQNLGDAVMRFRVENSYAKDIKHFLFFTYRNAKEKTNSLLDYFVGKLKYDKIHFEMVASWITQNTLNEWMCSLIFYSKEIRSVVEAMDYLTKHLNFKPLFWRRVSFGYIGNESLSTLMTYTTERKFKDSCDLISVMCDYTNIFTKGKISFYEDYFLFKLAWQVSDETFTKIINNIRKHNTTFELIPTTLHSSYRQYFAQLFNSNRSVEQMPPPYILSRWTDLLWAFNAPQDSLPKIMKFFPRHSKHCQEIFNFRH